MTTPYVNAGQGAPVIVQGQAVNQHQEWNRDSKLIQGSTYSGNAGDNEGIVKGEPQPRTCRDGVFAILFYVHLIMVGYATAVYAPLMAEDVAEGYAAGAQGRRLLSITRWLEDDAGNGGDDDEEFVDLNSMLLILTIAGVAGFFLSSLAMVFTMNFAQGLIKMALFFNIIVSLVVTLIALGSGAPQVALMPAIGFLVSVYYTYVVWKRIPFAAENLITAITAVRSNMGLAFFAYTNLLVSFLWSIWWAVAFVTTTYVLGGCDAEGNCEQEINGFLVFLFLVSYFWTAQVIKNVVHTTVAGTVGHWWFTPLEANSCCSQAVKDSYVRSITTSFGSICLGSLIVAVIQAVKEIIHSLREQDDSIIFCIAECLLGLIESIAEYFNQWAFVYVGIYGYNFMEAGMNVMTLFKSRGWTAIIADVLVDTVLMMISLAVGVLTGLVSVLFGSMMSLEQTTLAGVFIAGMLIGFVMCSTLFSLVSSAVNAVIVCYAEAPAEFQTNYPQLSESMRDAWRQAYPEHFRY